MNNLLNQENNLSLNAEVEILQLLAQKNKIENTMSELTEKIKEEMKNRNIIKIESENLLISYIAPAERETFQSKLFRDEHEDLYNEYVKITPIKDSIRIKQKNGDI